MKKHRHIKLVTTEARKTYFIPKPNYLQFFSEILLAIELKKTQIVYLGKQILAIRKVVMQELWYDYVKQNYGEK